MTVMGMQKGMPQPFRYYDIIFAAYTLMMQSVANYKHRKSGSHSLVGGEAKNPLPTITDWSYVAVLMDFCR